MLEAGIQRRGRRHPGVQPEHPERRQPRRGRRLPPEAFRHVAFYNEPRPASRCTSSPTRRRWCTRRLGLTIGSPWREHLDRELVQVHARGQAMLEAAGLGSQLARRPREVLRPRSRRVRAVTPRRPPATPAACPDGAAYAQPTPRCCTSTTISPTKWPALGPPPPPPPSPALLALETRPREGHGPHAGRAGRACHRPGSARPIRSGPRIGRAGERVARALHARPAGSRASAGSGLLARRTAAETTISSAPCRPHSPPSSPASAACSSLAVVDDTVFSGLTLRSVLEALPARAPRRTHVFCLRGVAESIAAVARLARSPPAWPRRDACSTT